MMVVNTNYVGLCWDRGNKIVLRQSHLFCGKICRLLHPLSEDVVKCEKYEMSR